MPTARLALPYPVLANSANVPADITALANALDSLAVWGQGTLAARPAAVGTTGRIYYATDNGHVYVNTGTAWVDIGPNVVGPDSITAAMIAPDAVGSSELANDSVDTAAIQALAVTNAKIAALSVDGGKIAASLKPSGGAGGATEALRALGTAAGTALAGDAAVATPVTAVSGFAKQQTQTYTITAPVAGTYVLEFGCGYVDTVSQGSTKTLSSNKGGNVSYSDTGGGGGIGFVASAICTAGEVITITCNHVAGSAIMTLYECFAKLTRKA